MTRNYKPLKDEQPLYYSTTVENGKIVKHDNDPKHAVYSSQIETIQQRAKLWHDWLAENVSDAYEYGVVKDEVAVKYNDVMQEFMDGIR